MKLYYSIKADCFDTGDVDARLNIMLYIPNDYYIWSINNVMYAFKFNRLSVYMYNGSAIKNHYVINIIESSYIIYNVWDASSTEYALAHIAHWFILCLITKFNLFEANKRMEHPTNI